ncbi:hypothetical protein EJ08DRAFT_706428 [Tothia fuscella]|uniref:Uncharacterized protein n=1 Tax=Tothia fuscella TaxID=1048955 RepID=A0A9P4NG45_9PEZI|nr:hypothetical protein EJ08DRAFT_706428 [Tothia fuscella]
MKLYQALTLFSATGALSASTIPHASNIEGVLRYTHQFAPFSGGYGKVPDPPGAAPRKQILTSPSKIPGAQRVKIRSGPYNVASMSKKSASGHAGMLENYPDTAVDKPCEECTLLWQQAGMEYPNGTVANVDTGMWLHHMVHFNKGPTRWDPTGKDRFCIPFLPVFLSPKTSERFYTAGNERTLMDYNPQGKEGDLTTGSGYYLRKEDKFAFLVELMNMNMVDTVVYITMVYDFLPGPLPEGWTEAKTVWLDANQCGTSEVWPPQEKGTFTIDTQPWKPNFEGKLLWSIVHQHDGGMDVEVRNTNNTVCKGVAKYSETPAYIYRGSSMGGDKVAKDHISSMPGCGAEGSAGLEVKRDQVWSLKGKYDYDQREGNLENGRQAEIMVLGLLLVSVPPGPLTPLISKWTYS